VAGGFESRSRWRDELLQASPPGHILRATITVTERKRRQMIRKNLIAGLLLAMVFTAPGQAQEAPYIDNRSDAASLVRSLYNAINRQEYARAWSYFGDLKPSKSLEDYMAGYNDTARIELTLGRASSEGAAGSTYYSIPVAIEAFSKDNSSKVFAGCYTARLANPGAQGDGFLPMHIEKGALKPSDKPLAEAAPANCGEAQPAGDDAVLSQAKSAFIATNAPSCDNIDGTTGLPKDKIADHTIKYHDSEDATTEPERTARLIAFPCFAGAYNFSTIYYQWDETEGLRQIGFPSPTLDIEYEDPNNTESKLHSVTVTGFEADAQLMNSEFDPATNTITSQEKWRGVGDASSSGKWAFKDGSFVLVKYDVDASYDGEINPETVVDYDTAP
jgi:hypothetical protein